MKSRLNLIAAIIIAGILVFTCATATVETSTKNATRIQFSEIPTDSVLLHALSPDIAGLQKVYKARDAGDYSKALESLAHYFKETAKERFYFSWEDFGDKYQRYQKDYPGRLKSHARLSADMKAMYGTDTQWQLPFKNLRGEDVTAYRLRHLARQSKHLDMVMMYFADPGEEENLKYWTQQMADLNQAFTAGDYDQGGNAVYEVFRAGKRTHHWLQGHHSYLSTPAYTAQDQIETMRTFLHTAAQLAENGKKVRHGNHHTRGMVALFEIAATYREFAQADEWLKLAINGVTWHLENEINPDGFQFERTIHYHQSDIENFLRVWQLAKRGNIELPAVYTAQFRKMFDALLILGQPDRKLPVLQDDTDALHAEVNEMSGVMALGTILYQDERYAYFVDEGVSRLFFWLLSEQELNTLTSTQPIAPELGSTALESTGYYVMRNGWNENSEFMVISAGLSEEKPDHQHADMLGVVAYADGNEILPNYQVKYNKPDFRYWKNSWVKSVVMIDSIPQAMDWKGNRGGSGFGKWRDLPEPEVLAFETLDKYDYFAGSHDGYDKIGIAYQREVIFVKDGFWIIKDTYGNPSATEHTYQQQWQGKYKQSGPKAAIATFENGATFEIRSLDNVESEWVYGSVKNKGSVIRQETSSSKSYSQITLLIPRSSEDRNLPGGWEVVTGKKLKKHFPELHAKGVGWVLQQGERSLAYTDHISLDKMGLELNHKVFVISEHGDDLLLGPKLPMAMPVNRKE